MAAIETRYKKEIRADGTTVQKPVYRVKIRLKGQAPVHATFDRLTDAKRFIQSTEAAIREGRYFKRQTDLTLAQVIERYEAEIMPTKRPATAINQKIQLDWWKLKIGAVRLCDVTASVISARKQELLIGDATREIPAKSNATVVRYLASLSHVFSMAAGEWQLTDKNPVKDVKKPRVQNQRTRFLGDDEKARLLKTCKASSDPLLFPAVLLAILTGCRKGEIRRLNWADVDLRQGLIRIRETKNGEPRSTALPKLGIELLQELAKVRRIDTHFLFPSADGQKPHDFRPAWEKARAAAKIEDFRFHDLRHCCASYLAMSGASLRDIMEVLGHKTTQMAKRYSHLSIEHQREKLEKMTEKYLEENG